MPQTIIDAPPTRPRTRRGGHRVLRQWLAALALFAVLAALHGGRPLWHGDVPPCENLQNLPNCAFSWACVRERVLPLWNPYPFGGMPHLGSHHAAALYPLVYIFFALWTPFRAFGLLQAFHYFWAGLGTWALLRWGWRLRPWAALAGGVFFMLSGFLIAHEPHAPMVWAIAWAPWMFWLAHRLRHGRRWAGPLLALALAVQVGAGYMQTTVMTCLALGSEALVEGLDWRRGRVTRRAYWRNALRRLGPWALAMAVGLGIMSVQFLSTLGMLPMTHRETMDYPNFVSHAFPWAQLPSLFFPMMLGAESPLFIVKTHTFGIWGQPEVVGSMGAAAWIGLLLLLFRGGDAARAPRILRPSVRRAAGFWIAMTVFCLLSLPGDSPFNRLMFHMPVVNLFRVQSRWLFLMSLGLAALAALGFDRLLHNIERGRSPRLGRPLGAGLTLVLFAFPLAELWIRVTRHHGDLPINWDWFFTRWMHIWNPAFWQPIAFGLIALGVLWWLWRRPRTWRAWLTLFIALYAVEQGFLTAQTVIRLTNPAGWHMPPGNKSVTWMLRQNDGDASRFRVFTPTGNDIQLSEETLFFLMPQLNGIYSAVGYWPFMPPTYSRLIRTQSIGTTDDPIGLARHPWILNMLNVRYFLIGHWFAGYWPIPYSANLPRPQLLREFLNKDRYPWLEWGHRTPHGVTILNNTAALPRAWLVERLTSVRTSDEALARLWEDRPFDPAREALVDPAGGPLTSPTDGLSSGTVRFTQRQFDKLRMEVTCPNGPGFLVLSEAWYPGWYARLDNKLVPIHRVNAVLRGLAIPQGTHQIYLRYMPDEFKRGLKISLLFVIAWMAWVGWDFWGMRRKNINQR